MYREEISVGHFFFVIYMVNGIEGEKKGKEQIFNMVIGEMGAIGDGLLVFKGTTIQKSEVLM